MTNPQYAIYSDLQNSVDATILAQLCSDNGASSPNSGIAVTMLKRSSSLVQAYARVGNIYTDNDLTALSTDPANPLLVMLVCDLATEMLFQRRAMKIPPAVESRLEQAKGMLEALRDGKMIFGSISKAADAGLPEVAATPQYNLAYYNNVSSSAFFRPRSYNVYRGG